MVFDSLQLAVPVSCTAVDGTCPRAGFDRRRINMIDTSEGLAYLQFLGLLISGPGGRPMYDIAGKMSKLEVIIHQSLKYGTFVPQLARKLHDDPVYGLL